LGDYLYAILIFFIIGFLFPKIKIYQVAVTSIIICYGIEFFQLYNADWIQGIRNHTIGKLILGQGFLYSDIISYTVGGITGYALEIWLLYTKKGS